MAKKSLKKFCRLAKFIEQYDKDLFQVFDDLCIMYLLKPAKGSNGITFLYPKTKTYKQRIINAAYSHDPDVAVNMLKSLIIQGDMKDVKDFNNSPVNLLNQVIDVDSIDSSSVKLANGLVLKKNKDFQPVSYRDNMAVYDLSGKGEIPLDGKVATAKSINKSPKKGGMLCNPKLSKMLESIYANSDKYSLSENIYCKKVYLQLGLIYKNNGNSSPKDLEKYLGNDEFSDSHLLDLYCAKNCNNCLSHLEECFSSTACMELLNSRVKRINYLNRKAKVCKQVTGMEEANNSVDRTKIKFNFSSPVEVRDAVKRYYRSAEKSNYCMGKDIFIVFTNIAKDLWKNDSSMFHNWAYLSANVYDNVERLVKCEFEIARDLTLWGTLLKSDVMLYRPQATFETPPSGYESSSMPKPIELKKFSLNKYIENLANGNAVKGGSNVESLVGGLLEGENIEI